MNETNVTIGPKLAKVKRLIAVGASVPMAIKDTLGMSVVAFCEKYELPRSATAEAINADRRATDQAVEALVAELGGTADEWRELLQQGRVAKAQEAA